MFALQMSVNTSCGGGGDSSGQDVIVKKSFGIVQNMGKNKFTDKDAEIYSISCNDSQRLNDNVNNVLTSYSE